MIALLVLSIVATIASTVMQATAAAAQAKATQQLAERQATTAERASAAKAGQLRRLRKIKIRRMSEAVGKSGVRSDLGTPLDGILDTSAQMEMEAIAVERGGVYQAEGHRAAGENARYAGQMGVASAVIGGVSTVASLGSSYAAASTSTELGKT